MADPSMERLDADKNGEVSADEFAAMETRMFERFDRNGDNKIDVTDFYRNRRTTTKPFEANKKRSQSSPAGLTSPAGFCHMPL
jgi:Ca2+-binding EF-hand superfamily protein